MAFAKKLLPVHFRHESATAKLTLYGSVASLSSLYSRKLGQGHATELMRQVIRFADVNKLELVLEVGRFGYSHKGALDNEQLFEFYEKFGFVRADSRSKIMRRPSQELHAL